MTFIRLVSFILGIGPSPFVIMVMFFLLLQKVHSFTLTTYTLPICNGENCSVDNLIYSAARPFVEFHNVIVMSREKRCYSGVSLPARQRHIIFKDVTVTLKSSEGDN